MSRRGSIFHYRHHFLFTGYSVLDSNFEAYIGFGIRHHYHHPTRHRRPAGGILFDEDTIRCVPPQMGSAHFSFPGSSSGMEDRIQEGVCWVWKHEKNQPRISANPPSGRDNRICLSSLSQSSFAVLLVPSSGPFGQILSAPQRLLYKVFRIFSFFRYFSSE